MPDYEPLKKSLYKGNRDEVRVLIEEALAEGREAGEILEMGLIAGMSVVGEDFKHNRIYVPQVLIAARAMKAGMALLRPSLARSATSQSTGTVVMGTVKGDFHDIGKNLVCMMAEGAGFTMIDLGVNQPAEKFIEAAREHNPGIVGMSALLTTTMPYMRVVIEAFRKEGLEHVKMCIGGAPVNERFAGEIGAHGYGPDAGSAVDLFKRIYPKKGRCSIASST